MSSVTAKPKPKPKPKPADDERLRDAWITLPLLMPVVRDRYGYRAVSHDVLLANEEMLRSPERRDHRNVDYYTFDMRVRPEAVTAVGRDNGPDGTIILINGVQHTCRLGPKAIWEMLL